MDFLSLKFMAPMAVIALVAVARWFNVKASGEPFIPGVGTEQRSGKSSGAGIPLSEERTGGDLKAEPGMKSSGTVGDPGTFEDSSTPQVNDTIYTGRNEYARAAPGRISGGGGGYQGVPPALQSVAAGRVASWDTSPLSSPTPTTNTPLNQFGGGLGGGVFAL